MSKARGSKKGTPFERWLSNQLSLWWTGGKREDVFWRTGGSGGRAKTRGRKGKQTYGQCGDVSAADPLGDPFIKVFTVEAKRGYNRVTLTDLLDYPISAKQGTLESWIQQAHESHKQASSLGWMLIHKRDLRNPLVMITHRMYRTIRNHGGFKGNPCPLLLLDFKLRQEIKVGQKKERVESQERVVCTTLGVFFRCVSAEVVQRVAKEEVES